MTYLLIYLEYNYLNLIHLKCFMDYLANKGAINCIKVGGNGGSLAKRY